MRSFFLSIAIVLFALSTCGCSSNNCAQVASEIAHESEETESVHSINELPEEPETVPSIDEVPAEPEKPEQSTPQPTEDWQGAYALFLQEFPFLDDDSFSALGAEETLFTFQLRDLDNSGIPELLLFKQQKMGFDQVFTAYSYDGTVYNLGEYSNPKGNFVSWFRISENPLYPGLFECWHGGGLDHGGYLTVVSGELEYEYLFLMDRGEYTEYSNNKQLVNECINAFPPYSNTENLLDQYFINDETIAEIVLAPYQQTNGAGDHQ